eukprot:365163-Chlamydomonas_euryale.AAC.7
MEVQEGGVGSMDGGRVGGGAGAKFGVRPLAKLAAMRLHANASCRVWTHAACVDTPAHPTSPHAPRGACRRRHAHESLAALVPLCGASGVVCVLRASGVSGSDSELPPYPGCEDKVWECGQPSRHDMRTQFAARQLFLWPPTLAFYLVPHRPCTKFHTGLYLVPHRPHTLFHTCLIPYSTQASYLIPNRPRTLFHPLGQLVTCAAEASPSAARG